MADQTIACLVTRNADFVFWPSSTTNFKLGKQFVRWGLRDALLANVSGEGGSDVGEEMIQDCGDCFGHKLNRSIRQVSDESDYRMSLGDGGGRVAKADSLHAPVKEDSLPNRSR